MIGKPEWFTYRTFGWGIAPKTWQGWLYVIGIALIAGFITAIGFTGAIGPWLFGILFALVILDVLHIMVQLPKVHDERENYHQLLIERNCSFAAIAALVGMALYQSYANTAAIAAGQFPYDVSIIVVLIAMVVVKAASTMYVRTKL